MPAESYGWHTGLYSIDYIQYTIQPSVKYLVNTIDQQDRQWTLKWIVFTSWTWRVLKEAAYEPELLCTSNVPNRPLCDLLPTLNDYVIKWAAAWLHWPYVAFWSKSFLKPFHCPCSELLIWAGLKRLYTHLACTIRPLDWPQSKPLVNSLCFVCSPCSNRLGGLRKGESSGNVVQI